MVMVVEVVVVVVVVVEVVVLEVVAAMAASEASASVAASPTKVPKSADLLDRGETREAIMVRLNQSINQLTYIA